MIASCSPFQTQPNMQFLLAPFHKPQNACPPLPDFGFGVELVFWPAAMDALETFSSVSWLVPRGPVEPKARSEGARAPARGTACGTSEWVLPLPLGGCLKTIPGCPGGLFFYSTTRNPDTKRTLKDPYTGGMTSKRKSALELQHPS